MSEFSVSPSQKCGVEVRGETKNICPGCCSELDPGICLLPPQSLLFKVKPIGAVSADSGGSKNMRNVESIIHSTLWALLVFTPLHTWPVATESGRGCHFVGFGKLDILVRHIAFRLSKQHSKTYWRIYCIFTPCWITEVRNVLRFIVRQVENLKEKYLKHVEGKCVYQKVNYRCLLQNHRLIAVRASWFGFTTGWSRF